MANAAPMAKPYNQPSLTPYPTESASAHSRPGHSPSVAFTRYACLAQDCDARFKGQPDYRSHTNTHNDRIKLKGKIGVPCNIKLAECKEQYLQSNRQKQPVTHNSFYACPESDCNELVSNNKRGYKRLLNHFRNDHKLQEAQLHKRKVCNDASIAYLGSLDWIIIMSDPVVNPAQPGRKKSTSPPNLVYACLGDHCDTVFQEGYDYRKHMNKKHHHKTLSKQNKATPVPFNVKLAQMKANYLSCNRQPVQIKKNAFLVCPEPDCNMLQFNSNNNLLRMHVHSKEVHGLNESNLPTHKQYKEAANAFLRPKAWVFMK